MRRNSITPSRAFLTIGLSVRMICPSVAGKRTARLRLGRPGRNLDQAHAAIARDAQPLMIAKARDFLARKLARLQDGSACGDFDFEAVYGDFRHGSVFLSFQQPIGCGSKHRARPAGDTEISIFVGLHRLIANANA